MMTQKNGEIGVSSFSCAQLEAGMNRLGICIARYESIAAGVF